MNLNLIPIPKRVNRNRALLFVCDIQQNFAPKTYGSEGALQASVLMVKMANIFGIPVITTEHNKKSFGPTCKQILAVLPTKDNYIIPKTKFSMISEEVKSVMAKYKQRNQVILVGMETHICVLQTSLDLVKTYDVFVPADAVTSSRAWERSIALQRLQNEGIIVSSFQSLAFELLGDSKDEKFKEILQIIKQNPRNNAISHL